MRILYLATSIDTSNGWGNVAFNLIEGMARVCPQIDFDVYMETERGFLGKNRLKSSAVEKFSYLPCLYDVVNVLATKSGAFDLIHVAVEYYVAAGMFLSKLLNIPYIITAHGTYAAKLPVKYGLYRRSFANASRVIAVSSYTKKRLIEESIRHDIDIIRLGVDKRKFYPDPHITREKTITFVGNFKLRKGISFLLETMERVNAQDPEIKLQVIGPATDSPESRSARQYVSRRHLNVEFAGRISDDDLVAAYRKARLNILPSRSERFHFEGFGLIHLEANACGTLTVGTYNSGNEDAVIPPRGFLVHYGDAARLSEIILDVMGKEPYPHIEASLVRDIKDMAQEYCRIYTSLVKSSRGSGHG
jgi:glycosyltransferase involved in cell wall biosynthesis